MQRRLIVGVVGASGVVLALETLRLLAAAEVETMARNIVQAAGPDDTRRAHVT